MSERTPATKLRVGKTKVSVTTSGTFQCSIQIDFEVENKGLVDIVIKKLTDLEVYGADTIEEHAVDVLKNDLEQLEKAKEIIIREHKAEIASFLQTAALRTKELERLQKMETELTALSGLAVNKVVR